ncbi:hypothetical protein Goklo_012485, partial [Gossypium klotzschianum]|nr:hypothetical protein [Gossypium klotzschianum]
INAPPIQTYPNSLEKFNTYFAIQNVQVSHPIDLNFVSNQLEFKYLDQLYNWVGYLVYKLEVFATKTLLEPLTLTLSLPMVTLVEPSFPSLLISWLKRLISLFLPLQDIFPFQMRVMVTTMAYSLTTLSTLTAMQ